MEHSRTPWRGCNEGNCLCCQIWSEPDDHPVAKIECGDWGDEYPTLKLKGPSLDVKAVSVMDKIVYGSIDPEVAKANVKFIVKACNSHDELLEALKNAMSWIDNWSPAFTEEEEWSDDEEIIRAAIAKAGAK